MSTFFIADDSMEKILFLRHMLTQAGWAGTVVTAMTTEEAKKLIDTNPDIAAAFIDYYIPTENGPSVIRYLKNACPAARIALVSSADNPRNTARAFDAGAEAAICTTRSLELVEQQILDLLQEWGAQD